MVTTITTISLRPELMAYATEKKIKLSHIVQEKLNEMMENDKASAEMVKNMQHKISFLQETINKQRNFIEAKGLMDDFCEDVS